MNSWLIVIAALFPSETRREPLQIRPTKEAPGVEVVADLPPAAIREFAGEKIDAKVARKWLTFAIVGRKGQPGPAMFGKYVRRGRQLVFIPRFSPSPDHRYRATVRLSKTKTFSIDYRAPKQPLGEPVVVETIYPSASPLPANNLKFYIHFSKPMREGKAIFSSIQLVDGRGQHVDDPWRRVEIWSRDYKRLTLFVHPGRIKTGVNLRNDLGPVLEPGRTYRLVVSCDVLDAAGKRLSKAYVKTFRATPADTTRPLPQRWKLNAPQVGTKDSLTVTFGEPLDRLLLTRMLTVRDSTGRTVKGAVVVGKHERSWSFQPHEPWRDGEYRLDIDRELEDLAGNTPRRVFDRDVKKPVGEKPVLSRKFRPKLAKPRAANKTP